MERTGITPLEPQAPRDPHWVTFRKRIIAALVRVDSERFWYLDENTCAGACPVCRSGWVTVSFHGTAPRADLACSLGCPEHEIAGDAGRPIHCAGEETAPEPPAELEPGQALELLRSTWGTLAPDRPRTVAA